MIANDKENLPCNLTDEELNLLKKDMQESAKKIQKLLLQEQEGHQSNSASH